MLLLVGGKAEQFLHLIRMVKVRVEMLWHPHSRRLAEK